MITIMNIIDVGAGKCSQYHALLVQHPSLKIYAIEPHPELFKKLITIRSSMTSECAERLYLINEAISTVEGNNTFYMNNDFGTSSLLPIIQESATKWKYPVGRRAIKCVGQKTVTCVRLDSIMKRYNIRFVDLLNIDTQGNSVDVIKSMSMEHYNHVKQIIVKVHTDDLGFELYKGQSKASSVMRELKVRYFLFHDNQMYYRNQEQIMTFVNEKLLNKKTPLPFL